MTDPEVIAPWLFRAWAKFPIFFQFPSLYSAIVDEYLGEPRVKPPMIKTLSSVWAVAYSDILKIFYTLAISKIVVELFTLEINIPIAIRKWVIGKLWPFLCFKIKNFGLQSISARFLTGNKWWVLVRSKRKDISMGEFRWWFCFEGFSIKTKK